MQRLAEWDTTQKSFHIPEGVEYIGMRDVAGVETLEELFIPKSLKRIEKSTFEGCAKLQITVDPGNPWFCSEDGALYNKAKTILYRGPGRCQRFVVPESVRVLHDDALSELPDLKYLTLPKKLKEIRDCALTNFAGEQLILPDTLESIGEYALAWTKVKHLYLPKSVHKICLSAFLSSSAVTINVDPENPHFSSENGALYNKEKTTLLFAVTRKGTFRVPATVKEIAPKAFTSAKHTIATVHLPEGLERVGEFAFHYCGIKVANFPSTLREVGSEAFAGIRGPRKLVVPKAMTSIPEGAFDTCNILNAIKFHSDVTHIGKRAFRGCWMLKELHLSKGLLEIDDDAFNNCALEKVTFPDSLKRIGARAFQGCDLKRIVLPPNLESIGSYAFYDPESYPPGRPRLNTVVFTGKPIPNIGRHAFPPKTQGIFPISYAREWLSVIRNVHWQGLRMGFYFEDDYEKAPIIFSDKLQHVKKGEKV